MTRTTRYKGRDGKERAVLYWGDYKKLLKLALLALTMTGCVSVVRELKAPPFPVVVKHQARATGLEATIPNQAGDAIVKIRFGFFSDSFYLIPTSTNQMYCPKMADDFTLGDTLSFTPTVTIKESSVFGWDGPTPPPPRFQRLFSPKGAP